MDFTDKINYNTLKQEEISMKTGKAAKALGVDPKTIRDWADREEFKPFFSDEALGVDMTQRDYSDLDLVVLNTIRSARSMNTEWEEIAKMLRDGYRDANLPASALLVADAAPIEQYAKRMQLQAEYEVALKQIEMLQAHLVEKDEKHREVEHRHREEITRLQKRIEELSEEVGKWKTYTQIYKEQLEDNK
jgi:DNA-binding transcriptional MerR regulator